MSSMFDRLAGSTELMWRVPLVVVLIVAVIVAHVADPDNVSWQLMAWYGFALIATAQVSRTAREFFRGEGPGFFATLDYYVRGTPLPGSSVNPTAAEEAEARRRSEVGFWTLMPSAFITWIFAKSIQNAATFGGRWGILGGVGYAGWYLSFFAAALVGYVLRTRAGFQSLPTAIERCYGPLATLGFGLALMYRLWNEIWSNSVVVASFYGPVHSPMWWAAAMVSTAIPAVYVLMGGMRSSLVSDVLQAGLGLLFLFVILGLIGERMPGGLDALWAWSPPGGWTPGVGTVIAASSLQGALSYPFHDPVLTDRAFLSRPRTMVAALTLGGLIAMMFIVLFSGIGVYGAFLANRVGAGSPAFVARSMDATAFAFINLVMMTSSMSTLDSTFSSVGKLVALELGGWMHLPGDKRAERRPLKPSDMENIGPVHLVVARVSIVVLAVVGTLNLVADAEAINATVVSGTMVMGLGPPVWLTLLWKFNSKPGADDGWRQAPLAFIFSFLPGIVFGAVYSVATAKVYEGGVIVGSRYPAAADILTPFAMGDGPFAAFFGWNVTGHCICFAGSALGFAINQFVWRLPSCDAEPTFEDPATGETVVRPGYEAAAAELSAAKQDKTAAARA